MVESGFTTSKIREKTMNNNDIYVDEDSDEPNRKKPYKVTGKLARVTIILAGN